MLLFDIFIISLVSGAIIIMGLIFSGLFFYIRVKYREYDENETLKEQNGIWKNRINEALKFFRDNYNDDLNHSAYDNVRIKTDFILKLISKKNSLKDQNHYYNMLFSMLYETAARMKTEIDVKKILSPLTGLYEELVTEHLNYLKENSDFN